MLATLRVKNMALAEKIEVEFGPGLNIITGETGAGKSILMGALAILMGERADKSLIRAGEDACGAEAVFHLADASEIDAILEQNALPPCADGELILRRLVRASGPGQNLVNDSPVTLPVLKSIGEFLVDMHGPHDHQSLLRTETQLAMLDAFGRLWDQRLKYETVYDELRALEKQRDELTAAEDVSGQIEMLNWRIREIREAALQEGEEEQIETEHQVLGHAGRIQELAGAVVQALTGADEGSAFDVLSGSRRALEELQRLLPEAETWAAETDDILRRMQELDMNIRRAAEDIEASPARLAWLDERLAVYHKLKRKYGTDVGGLLALQRESEEKLKMLQTREERLGQIQAEIAACTARLEKQALALREKRVAASTRLSSLIEKELKALGLAHGEFVITFREAQPSASGMDEVEFEFAPNLGEPVSPMRTIASSGEISRVMLAVKKVLADHDRIPVLVFDEIDSNIGGEIGSAVGRKLREVASGHQVLCITHLPQVAVFGARHYAVSKQVRSGRTVSSVLPLDGESRVEEVARMLGGRELTSVTLKHAREMLAGA
ncbi:MAG TPA: DNA repair protein RecN [Kiritimatiellia bacterium]|nr:DNA repair protein RecN [Kiritimatiellia bacterium]HPA77988.1 DNA repair protein RecN [Kiritimatiellia bacterium]HQQ03857.1 DNA repair protein RecN [Kiritimatiellia bacterium]